MIDAYLPDLPGIIPVLLESPIKRGGDGCPTETLDDLDGPEIGDGHDPGKDGDPYPVVPRSFHEIEVRTILQEELGDGE